MQQQTRQALRNIETILKVAASSLDRVVKVTVLLVRPDLQRDERRLVLDLRSGSALKLQS
jgi:enamine deaminase RidA (YjgF/YER057c/UK114 family)